SVTSPPPAATSPSKPAAMSPSSPASPSPHGPSPAPARTPPPPPATPATSAFPAPTSPSIPAPASSPTPSARRTPPAASPCRRGTAWRITSAAPAVLFAADGPQVVRAEVEQEFARRIKEGQPAVVQDEADATLTWRGRVERVASWDSERRMVLREPD